MSAKTILKKIYYKPVIQNNFLKLISPIFPEPENCIDAELHYGVWNTSSNIFQVNGRQLGEANVDQGFRRRKFPIEYRECKIEGSRLGKQTNLTALQDIMRSYSDAMQILMMIREHYINALSIDSQVFDAGTIFQFTQHVVSLPLFMYRDKSQGTNQNKLIDLQITTLFQLVAGVFNLIRRLLEDKSENINLESHVDAEQLYAFSEKSHLFTTPNSDKTGEDKVCGGAKLKVIELLDVIINGTEAKKVYAKDTNALISRGVNADNYLAYSLTALQLETTINQCRLESLTQLLALNTDIESGKNIKLSDSEISHRQEIIDETEFSNILKGAFTTLERQKECQDLINYRLSFVFNINMKIQTNRQLINENLNVNSLVTPNNKPVNGHYSFEQHKSNFESQLLDYTNTVILLQQKLLNILKDPRKTKKYYRYLNNKMSIFS